jgi:hypothetical protein
MRLPVLAFAALALVAAACDPGLDAGDVSADQAAKLSAEDVARILDLVNDPATDLALLDGAIGLDARAAKSIAGYRAGADGVMPSADDRYFDSFQALDSLPSVGDAAIAKLGAYALAHPAPKGEVVEGVSFRGWEAQAVVWGVNHDRQASLDALLDARAAAGLVARRPFATVSAMGPVPYVGAAALVRLRANAAVWWRAQRPDCIGAFSDAVAPHLGDLLFLSESDRPIDVVSYAGAGGAAPTAASFMALMVVAPGTTAEQRDVARFYQALEPASGEADPNAAAAVQAAVAAQLTDVIYVAIQPPPGDPYHCVLQVYLVGRTACGDLVALHSEAVET